MPEDNNNKNIGGKKLILNNLDYKLGKNFLELRLFYPIQILDGFQKKDSLQHPPLNNLSFQIQFPPRGLPSFPLNSLTQERMHSVTYEVTIGQLSS